MNSTLFKAILLLDYYKFRNIILFRCLVGFYFINRFGFLDEFWSAKTDARETSAFNR